MAFLVSGHPTSSKSGVYEVCVTKSVSQKRDTDFVTQIDMNGLNPVKKQREIAKKMHFR